MSSRNVERKQRMEEKRRFVWLVFDQINWLGVTGRLKKITCEKKKKIISQLEMHLIKLTNPSAANTEREREKSCKEHKHR